MRPKTIAVFILSVLMLVVLYQNTHDITVHFLFWKIILPQIFLIFLTLIAGFLLGYLVARIPRHRR